MSEPLLRDSDTVVAFSPVEKCSSDATALGFVKYLGDMFAGILTVADDALVAQAVQMFATIDSQRVMKVNGFGRKVGMNAFGQAQETWRGVCTILDTTKDSHTLAKDTAENVRAKVMELSATVGILIEQMEVPSPSTTAMSAPDQRSHAEIGRLFDVGERRIDPLVPVVNRGAWYDGMTTRQLADVGVNFETRGPVTHDFGGGPKKK